MCRSDFRFFLSILFIGIKSSHSNPSIIKGKQEGAKKLNELEKLRQEIDIWDKKLVETFEERMKVVLKILAYKKKHGLPIFHDQREEQVLQKVAHHLQNKDFADEIQTLYREIMGISRKLQSKHLLPFNIVLIGFMGSGKSTIGRILSQQLAIELLDTDQLIEKKINMTIKDIFEKHGEGYFRQVERNMIKALGQEEHKIIACGGGVVLNKENIRDLKNKGKIILLEASAETIYHRLQEDTTRPLLEGHMTKSHITSMLQDRNLYYQEAADIVIHTDGKDTKEIGEEIIFKLLSLCSSLDIRERG
ncbi:chorismate mutase [Clostridiaceae bacterium 35-E11]